MSQSGELNGIVEELYRIGRGLAAPRTFRQFVLAASADQAEQVLGNPDVFHKQYGALDLLFRARLNTDGNEWQARRALTQAHYNNAAKSQNVQRVAGIFDASLDDVRSSAHSEGVPRPSAVLHAVTTATTRIFFDAFGADHDTAGLAAGVEDLRRVVHALEEVSLCPRPSIDMNALTNRTAMTRRDLRRYAAQEPGVARLIAQFERDYGAEGFDAAGELLGNLVAGAESSATTLAWAMLMVGAFPDLQERLREEAGAEAPRPAMTVFLNEVLRLFPPFPAVTRFATRDFDSEAFSARKGASVLVSIVGVHLDPAHWNAPMRFDPERSEFADRTFNRKAFIPFLYGPRVCGGASLARTELNEGLSALLRRFRFRRTGDATEFHYAAVLRPVIEGALSVEAL